MTISGSISNAMSGLTANARAAETISQNVSNALTEGYGRREIELSSTSVNNRGTGVRVSGVFRRVDLALISQRRQAAADAGGNTLRAGSYQRMETALGLPGQGGSLSDLIAGFEASLVQASSRPDLLVRQQNVLYAAQDMVSSINTIADESQVMRMDADKKIDAQVTQLNGTLNDIAKLNRDIRLEIGAGRAPNGMMDRRQVLIDRIAEIVPLKTFPRDHGQVALVSAGGAILLDGNAAKFLFSPVAQITADMTLDSGALSGLTMNGNPTKIGQGSGLMEGGTLAALFEIRDQIGPAASARADAFARDLIDRFQQTGLDPTLSTGEPGLFTDGGTAFDPSLETGLAGRLSLNASVDPARGGALWRLRDGLGAVLEGESGNSTLLSGFAEQLALGRNIASGDFGSGVFTSAELAGTWSSLSSSSRVDAEQAQTFSTSRLQEFQQAEYEGGVDTDQEMQRLMMVEKAFAANARVISTADAMLKTLLGL